jgi:hypothetical protein
MAAKTGLSPECRNALLGNSGDPVQETAGEGVAVDADGMSALRRRSALN